MNIFLSNSVRNLLMHLYCQLFHLTAFDSDLYLDRTSFRFFFIFYDLYMSFVMKIDYWSTYFFCTKSYNSAGLIFKDAKEIYPGKQEEGLPIKLHTDCFQYSIWVGNCQYFSIQLACMFVEYNSFINKTFFL